MLGGERRREGAAAGPYLRWWDEKGAVFETVWDEDETLLLCKYDILCMTYL